MPLKIKSSKTYHHVVGVCYIKSVICGKCLLLVFHLSVISVGIIMAESLLNLYFNFFLCLMQRTNVIDTVNLITLYWASCIVFYSF